jgi:hypothetical protein
MPSRNIPRSQWAEKLQEFTNRNAGRETILDNYATEIGAQLEEKGYPLRGIAYDQKDSSIDIMLGHTGSTDQHLTRRVVNPISVDILSTGDGRDRALRIEHGGGETLLEMMRT